MYYMMEPLDSFFFRGSAPFEEGGETAAAESMFPPLPSVYAGAFRRLYRLDDGGAGRIKIGFNGVALGQEILYPMPADLFWSRGLQGGGGILRPLSLSARPISNYPLDYCLRRPGEDETKDKENRRPMLDRQEMCRYLNQEGTEYRCIDLNDGYLSRSVRLGIGLDPESGTSKEHMLYQVTEVRPAKDMPVRLAAEVNVREEGQPWEQLCEEGSGGSDSIKLIRLGGEGRLAAVRETEPAATPEAPDSESAYFKLYLATPAIFEKGWLPGWIDPESGEGTFTHKKRSVRVRLIAAGVGRGVPCGGYGRDEDGWHSRELRFAAPAGSVYYFRLLKGTYSDAVKLFHGRCISEYRESRGFDCPRYNKYRYCDRGFGFALVGKLGKEQEEKIDG